MSRAIGMIEFKTTPAGITAADAMVKTSEVEIVEAQTVCPGKYIAIITGDLSAVKAAVDTAVTTYEDKCIDSFVLGNPHESIFPAIYGTTQVEEISALGILETYDAASIIEAADQAAKTAIVDLIELRIAKGMCGKSYMLLTGEVSAVEASIERAKELVAEKYNRRIRNPYDLEPEEELLIGRYFKEEYGSDFVFVTHYPSKKRPFYAMDDPADEKFTLSFDLLFKGLEVTTGGQRIHDYQMLKDKIAARGMDEEGMEQYLDTFKHGMPPHGGLGIGLERLTMQILGEENVRETCLFPRDMNRLEP